MQCRALFVCVCVPMCVCICGLSKVNIAYAERLHHVLFGLCLCGMCNWAKLIGFCTSVRHDTVPTEGGGGTGATFKSNRIAAQRLSPRSQQAACKKVSQRYFCCCLADSTSFFSFNFRQQPQQAATRCAWHAPHKEADREMRQTEQEAGEAEMKE